MEQVYLLTPDEYNGLNVVKIGMHRGNTLIRVNSYGKNTKIYLIKTVYNSKIVEKEIIKQFKMRFKIYKGREYFECDINESINLFDRIVNKLNKHFVKKCNLDPEYYKFHCKIYCHKNCYLKELINKNNDENNIFIYCVDCENKWKKRKVFYAKTFIKNTIFDKNKLDTIETEILVKNNKCYNFEDNIIVEGYDISNVLKFDESNKLLPKKEYNYPMYFYAHILYGQFRICDNIYGNINIDNEKKINFNNIYTKCIKETEYIILFIKKDNTDSLFFTGIGVAFKKKIIIIFDDNLYFPKDLDKINDEIVNYKSFWNIYQYNYILKKKEEDIILTFPILRDKFLTYEDYIDSQIKYKTIIEKDEKIRGIERFFKNK